MRNAGLIRRKYIQYTLSISILRLYLVKLSRITWIGIVLSVSTFNQVEDFVCAPDLMKCNNCEIRYMLYGTREIHPATLFRIVLTIVKMWFSCVWSLQNLWSTRYFKTLIRIIKKIRTFGGNYFRN